MTRDAGTAQAPDLLGTVLRDPAQDYAILARRDRDGQRVVDVVVGDVRERGLLRDVPLPSGPPATESLDVLVVVPFRQLRERGFVVRDDHAPLLTMEVTRRQRYDVGDVVARLPHVPTRATGGAFDLDDEAYGDLVRQVVEGRIGNGDGSNFVMRRSYEFRVDGFTPVTPLTVLGRLLADDPDAYWTFLIHLEDRWFVGASPEQHLVLDGTTVSMTPLSGTYRRTGRDVAPDDVLRFLRDRKEIDELNMVVDEELKMMARTCHDLRVRGPYLQELSSVAHTGYRIEGRSTADPRHVLTQSLFAPTVTGAPLESACRVIAATEPQGRGYYSGIAAVLGRDPAGAPTVDSAILIRTAEVAADGTVRIGVGSTIVRDSVPADECAETRAKVRGLLRAFAAPDERRLVDLPGVRDELRGRTADVAAHWLDGPLRSRSAAQVAGVDGAKVLVVDVEDSFASMIASQLESLGMRAEVRGVAERHDVDAWDLVVAGPGPGDPSDVGDRRIPALQHLVGRLLAGGPPFLAVCLSHQVLALRLGLSLTRLARPQQGTQREIDLFGTRRRVAFYNTFTVSADAAAADALAARGITLCQEAGSSAVHAIRGPRFTSMQFHPESFITLDGPAILAEEIRRLPVAVPRTAPRLELPGAVHV